MNAVLQFVAHRSKSTLESISCNKALAYAVGVESWVFILITGSGPEIIG